jgi:uncharacterized protein YndB with AHSA1/START domain
VYPHPCPASTVSEYHRLRLFGSSILISATIASRRSTHARNKSKVQRFIDAKPEDVFAYVSDLSKNGEWADAPLEITAVDGSEIAVGKRYRSTAEFRGGTVTGEQTITEYEAPRKFSFHVEDSTSKHDHIFAFTPEGEGTLMERRTIGQWSFGIWLLAATIGGVLIGKPAVRRAFEKLKGKLET